MRFERAEVDPDTTNRVRRTVARGVRLPAALTVEAAVSAVMCTLTERLTAGNAHELLDALPRSLQVMFERCVVHRDGEPTARLDRSAFVRRVAEHLGVTPAHAELVCAAVFTAVRAELTSEAMLRVADQLPRGLKELWLSAPIDAPDVDTGLAPEDARRALERALELRAHLPAHVTSGAAFAAVMCTFARRLSGGERRHVLDGLPPPVRGLVARCVSHREEPEHVGCDDVLASVRDHFVVDDDTAVQITIAVLRETRRMLPTYVREEIASQLPGDLRELWDRAR